MSEIREKIRALLGPLWGPGPVIAIQKFFGPAWEPFFGAATLLASVYATAVVISSAPWFVGS